MSTLSRRGFLGALAAGAAALATPKVLADPERELWTPGRKRLFLPPKKGWFSSDPMTPQEDIEFPYSAEFAAGPWPGVTPNDVYAKLKYLTREANGWEVTGRVVEQEAMELFYDGGAPLRTLPGKARVTETQTKTLSADQLKDIQSLLPKGTTEWQVEHIGHGVFSALAKVEKPVDSIALSFTLGHPEAGLP